MVTKKTRLLSAIAAVLMLVSMFAGFVIPATAEDSTLTPIADAAADDGKTAYEVASYEDLETLATVKSNLKAGDTVYITADIDMTDKPAPDLSGLVANLDGSKAADGKATITGLTVTTPWLGNYTGTSIKNLEFDTLIFTPTLGGTSKRYWGALTEKWSGTNLECKNITVRDSEVNGTNSIGRHSVLLGQVSPDETFSASDIEITGCTLTPGTNSNVGFFASQIAKGEATFENVYMNNNTFKGAVKVKQAMLVGEIKASAATLANILVYNGASEGGQLPSALFGVGDTVAVDIDMERVVVANVNAKTLVHGNEICTVDFQNSYTDIKTVYNTITKTDAEINADKEKIASGEAAWLMNKATNDKKWTMVKDETLGMAPVFGDAGNQTRKVTVKVMDVETDAEIDEYIDYTDADGKLLNTGAYASQADYWTQALDGAIEGEQVVGCVIPDHTCELVNYQSNNDGTHRYECGCKWTVTGVGVVSCDKTGTSDCNQNKKLNVTDENTEEPSLVHMVVSACSLCDYRDPNAVEEKCTGTITEVGRDPIENSCDLHVISACNKCDYEHVKTVAGEHSTVYKYRQSDAYPQYHEVLCSRCEMFLDLQGHSLNWEETTPPSVDQEGVKTGTCVCGKTETMVLDAKEGIEVVIEDDVYINQDFDVKVNLKNSSGVMFMKLNISFDETKVMLVGVENGGEWEKLVFDDKFPDGETDDGEVTLSLMNPTNMYLDGTMIVLKFKALYKPELLGETANITVTEEESWDRDGQAVVIDDTQGANEVELSIKKGDMNCDGFVNTVDASFLMRYVNEKALDADKHTLVGTTTLITDKMADLTDLGDDAENDAVPNVNVNDVIHLLRAQNGQIPL